MDAGVEQALAIGPDSPGRDRTVDITTIGRRSGEPRRLETWFYRADGVVYLSGMPGRRSWAANLEAEPAFTFHLKNDVVADLPARAERIVDEAERRRIFEILLPDLANVTGNPRDLEAWVADSPLFAVTFDDA